MKGVDWMRKILKRRMRLVALAGGCALLAGCASTITPSATTSTTSSANSSSALIAWHNACVAYSAAYAGALIAGQQGYLTKSDIQQVNLLSSTIDPLCTKEPANAQAVTQEITAAGTEMGLYEYLMIAKMQGAKK